MDKILAEEIKYANRMFYEIQKQRIAMSNRLDAKEKAGLVSKRTLDLFEKLEAIERAAQRVSEEMIDYTGLWDGFFEHIRGVGKLYASALVAEIQDIGKFSTVSKLWSFFGLTTQYVVCHCEEGHKLIMSSYKPVCPVLAEEKETGSNGDAEESGEKKPRTFKKCGAAVRLVEEVKGVSPKRKAGHHFLFNTRAKTLAWKISTNLMKQGDPFYRNIYDVTKEMYLNKGIKRGHAHNRALRKMVKVFLSHLWEAWREIEKLETRTPYVVDKMGHDGYMSWAELKVLLSETRSMVRQIGKKEKAA